MDRLLTSLIAASDKTPDGRHAIRTATVVASATGAALTVVEVVRINADTVVPIGRVSSTRDRRSQTDELVEFQQWVGPLEPPLAASHSEVAVAYGIPGIEIGRLADQRGAELVVLGRRPRSTDHPLLLGETADALVRRTSHPVLFVPPSITGIRTLLVALDGTERTIGLVRPASLLANAVGASVSALTVRASQPHEGPDRIRHLLASTDGGTELAVAVRCGNPIHEILDHIQSVKPDVLVIGYRRGGPPKVIGPADIARNLLYSSPSAVLTVPL